MFGFIKKVLKIALSLALVCALVLGGYIAYLQWNYYRIEDCTALEVVNNNSELLIPGTAYTALTYNIGFGAYSPEYTFFMDKGSFPGEELTHGIYGKAISKEAVIANTQGSIELLKSLNTDFMLLQEADIKAHRSYFVDQVDAVRKAFPSFASTFAYNFHSGFLALPLHDMHGAVDAGLLLLSNKQINGAIHRSLPVDNSFITKFTDLDRSMNQTRIAVEGGKELVLINAHLSAYDEGGVIRKQQFDLLNKIMNEEYQKGNYVIVGGDFNHALGNSKTMYSTKQNTPIWLADLDESSINENCYLVIAENIAQTPTCRACNIPYEKGVNFTVTIDGFIVSKNVTATAKNIDANFAYSDHNPVVLTFTLQ